MHPVSTLKSIYEEHRSSLPHMVETLMDLAVPVEDTLLLGMMPWEFPANRIAVERERLGLSPVRPLLELKLPPPPPAWLMPAMIVKMFNLALDGPSEPPPDQLGDDQEVVDLTNPALVLPA